MTINSKTIANMHSERTFEVEEKYYADEEDAYSMRKYFKTGGKSYVEFKKKLQDKGDWKEEPVEERKTDVPAASTTAEAGGEKELASAVEQPEKLTSDTNDTKKQGDRQASEQKKAA